MLTCLEHSRGSKSDAVARVKPGKQVHRGALSPFLGEDKGKDSEVPRDLLLGRSLNFL